MPLYDYLQNLLDGSGPSGPLAAGAVARMTAVLITSPLELVRTRTQALVSPDIAAPRVARCSQTAHMWSSLSSRAANLSAVARVQLLWQGKLLFLPEKRIQCLRSIIRQLLEPNYFPAVEPITGLPRPYT